MIKLGIQVYSFIVLLCMGSDYLLAQEYTIGPEDVLSITFWQEPTLNTSVRVSQDGTIVLPVIGSITAAGLTPTTLAVKIVDKISIFNNHISQASVVVTQYGSKRIYITGHVISPDKYTFEEIPDLWKIILEAGGPAETALLDQVKIIRSTAAGGETIVVDLEAFLKNGKTDMLPKIYPGDSIHVPGIKKEATGGEQSTIMGDSTNQTNGKMVFIYGQVVRPGGYVFNENLTLLDFIIIAGGPTPAARLNDVKIISRGKPHSTVATVNLEKYSKSGSPTPFLLELGDTIFIPQQKNSMWRVFQSGIVYDMLRMIVTVSTSVLIYNAIR